jgi:hypothetical protein
MNAADIIKTSVLASVLSKDIERVYKKIASEQEQSRPRASFSLPKERSLTDASASDFERNFKQLVREQGFGASPGGIAKMLVSAMPAAEQNRLEQSLIQSGVKTNGDFENLLGKWKTEALNIQSPSNERKITRTRTVNRGLSLGW